MSITKAGVGGSAAIGVGGFGGAGGDAGNVDVTFAGTIFAKPDTFIAEAVDPETGEVIAAHYSDGLGDGSHGIFAQSLGGGGGNGGVNVSAGLSFASTSKDEDKDGDGHALVIGVGGFGGGGGNAGSVDVTVDEGGSISSFGDNRSAIFAQSVGGGGGNGGVNVSVGIVSDAPIVVGIGGFGGAGGTASTVTVDATTNVFATGKNAYGILAQSIGGGGGNGGFNLSGAISYAKETTPPSITFGLGGFGGAGNISDDVSVTHLGNITTSGEQAHGLFAQSIAGGGGNGGMNISAALIYSTAENSGGFKDLSMVAGIGGHGGAGADAGDVVVVSNGHVTTSGDMARGIFAQSIGGGGGNGGINFSGNVSKKSSLITMGIGGFGSGGGDAGSVSVHRGSADTAAGKVTTSGTGALGIEASSIGGGGGDGGVNIVASVLLNKNSASENPKDTKSTRKHPKHTGVDESVFTNYDAVLDELEGKQKPDKEDDKDAAEGQSAFAAQIAIGGAGGTAGHGNSSTVNNFGDIETNGQQSHGILAQSIGGGGGNAAWNVTLSYIKEDSRNKGLNIALGGGTGAGGNGAEVSVVHNGLIETFGMDSYGILAQSIGGGGGNASANMNKSKADVGKIGISIGRNGGTGGVGADVSLDSTGSVITHGNGSYGLMAQSIGGGGGNSSATTFSIESAEDKKKKTPARGASMSIGLEGGIGATAGDVLLTAQGFVSTDGDSAHAVFAQSVGGGGGNGGDAEGTSANASLAIGGSGGTGGTGGEISIVSAADVRTKGAVSIGIMGQSIGGGGGNGGKSKATIEGDEIGVAVSLGGTGGTGAVAGRVTIENSGVIITDGEGAYGILAQSLGGGGGNGSQTDISLKTDDEEDDKEKDKDDDKDGGTGTGTGTGSGDGNDDNKEDKNKKIQFGVAIGGTGGIGAAGGDVSVTNTGGIGTIGNKAIGIFVQSVGGGGGNASQVATEVSKKSTAGSKFTMGIGGSGGVGGTGGDVFVENVKDSEGNVGKIITLGDEAHGILAMSIGGGGGTGSTVVTENKAKQKGTTPKAVAISMNLGGSGGEGGTSGQVTVTNDGEITTYGTTSHGIFAQSIGGGGGNGGVSFTKNKGSSNLGTTIKSDISVGGQGGNGNIAGDVTVTNTGSIEVFGDRSYGILAQSIGGGGGNGGLAGAEVEEPSDEPDGGVTPEDPEENEPKPQDQSLLNFALGGAGGDGADGGDVFVDHKGSIIAHGDDSYGIYAQSVGGGGGTVAATYSSPAGSLVDMLLPLLVGSRDGGSGKVGNVTVNTEGTITMTGDNSHSHYAQSINGGGGDVNVSLDISKAAIEAANTDNPDDPTRLEKIIAFAKGTFKIGSALVKDGEGADIDASHIGDLITLGRDAFGSSTQSIGGGGGNARVDILATEQSRIELELALGGSQSTNSGGGNVDLNRDGDVGTVGELSKGVSVQTIGGGGGNLNVIVRKIPIPAETEGQSTASLGGNSNPRTPASILPAGTGTSATLVLGSNGSAGNNGGDANLTFDGDVVTLGERSPGMVLQSIGAGGGDVRLTGMESLDVTFGATGDSTGDGGNIILANTGGVSTAGELSHGVVIQSIGGGGGAIFTDTDETGITLSLNSDNSGNGGDITFDQSGNIRVAGDRSIGLFAQSLGGGGGVIDRLFSDTAGGSGSSGDIILNIDGSVIADGAEGVAIFAQTRGVSGQGDITINLTTDNYIYGGEEGVGLWMSGGAENQVTSYGMMATYDGVFGMTAYATMGNNSVDNYGEFYGRFDLGAGVNRFINHEGAIFAPGPDLKLGAASNMLENRGTMAPGDMQRALGTDLTGSFSQSAAGLTYAELDFGTDLVDQIKATGTVDLAGEINVSLINPYRVPYGHFEKILFSGEQGLTHNGVSLTTAPSVVMTYDLVYPTNTTAVLDYNIDFSPEGLGSNLESVADYINRIQAAGGSSDLASVVTKLLYDPDMAAYRHTLSQLSPEFYGVQQAELLRNSQHFGQMMMSCRQTGSDYHYTREGSCVWFQAEDETSIREALGDFKAAKQTANRFAMGVQKTFNRDWAVGLGLAKESGSASGYQGNWTSSGDADQLALSLKHQSGPTKLIGVVSYGWNRIETYRSGQIAEPFRTKIDWDVDVASVLLRLSHDVESNDNFARPMVDFGVNRIMMGAATENGAGGTNLALAEHDETHSWMRPALEMGAKFKLASGARLRLSSTFGLQYYFDEPSTQIVAGFEGAPAGVDPMRVSIDLSRAAFHGTVGLDFEKAGNYVIRFQYNTIRTSHTHVNRANVKLRIPF